MNDLLIERIGGCFSVCKLSRAAGFLIKRGGLSALHPPYFLSATPDELSLVCGTSDVPDETEAREDGWAMFRVAGALDFALIGILAKITAALADAGISVFALSTYDTDYFMVREDKADEAEAALKRAGYTFIR